MGEMKVNPEYEYAPYAMRLLLLQGYLVGVMVRRVQITAEAVDGGLAMVEDVVGDTRRMEDEPRFGIQFKQVPKFIPE